MQLAGRYSFNGGAEVVKEKYPKLLEEVLEVIRSVNAFDHKTKSSKEKTMPGEMLFSPDGMNEAIRGEFNKRSWKKLRIPCEYSKDYYEPGYKPPKLRAGAFREMDFVKERLGVEVQFGKYAFMVYNVCAKMTIFNRKNHIDTGIEVVPMKALQDQMSTGVSYFEQFVWDLEARGVADIDIPVLVLGVDA